MEMLAEWFWFVRSVKSSTKFYLKISWLFGAWLDRSENTKNVAKINKLNLIKKTHLITESTDCYSLSNVRHFYTRKICMSTPLWLTRDFEHPAQCRRRLQPENNLDNLTPLISRGKSAPKGWGVVESVINKSWIGNFRFEKVAVKRRVDVWKK